jgi:citrate synthase
MRNGEVSVERKPSARVKIGKQSHSSSAISSSNPDTIVVRGRDLCSELVGHVSFSEHVWLLITGQLPSAAQRTVFDATLVAIAEHGLVPSVQVSRMTLAAAPEALQGAVAAGILGCGSVILGAAEAAGRLLVDVVANASQSDASAASPSGVAPTSEHAPGLDAAAARLVRAHRDERRAVPGFGHPLHKGNDPRVDRLFEVAEGAGLAGRHIEAARAVARVLPEISGKPLGMNVSVAIPAVLLDAGYPALALKGVPILARTASLVAHLLEEQLRPIGFVLSHAGAAAITYDGEAPEGFRPGQA